MLLGAMLALLLSNGPAGRRNTLKIGETESGIDGIFGQNASLFGQWCFSRLAKAAIAVVHV